MIAHIRNSYFRLLDAAVLHTGMSKKELHHWWIQKCYPFLLEDPSNFIDGFEYKESTTILTEKGWLTFYNEFRHFCLDVLKFS